MPYKDKEKDRECRRRAHARNPEIRQRARKAYNVRLRKLVLEHYGAYCHCPGCKVATFEFLAFDHVEGGGNKHHQELRQEGIGICNWLKKHNFPEGFQVLCHNCNMAKGFYGQCPHLKDNNG